jgi:hypothetical protein
MVMAAMSQVAMAMGVSGARMGKIGGVGRIGTDAGTSAAVAICL